MFFPYFFHLNFNKSSLQQLRQNLSMANKCNKLEIKAQLLTRDKHTFLSEKTIIFWFLKKIGTIQ